MPPLHRAALLTVAFAATVAGAWVLLFAVPDLLDRHRDGALALAVVLIAAVPAGLVWGATRLVTTLRDDPDDR